MTRTGKTLLIIAGAVVCISIIAAAIVVFNPFAAPEEEIAWNLTLQGAGGEVKTLTFSEIKALPASEGIGGFFTTVGIVNGPYRCRGVPVKDLCELVGGVEPANTVWVSAPDGYLMVFSYEQLQGAFRTFEPTSFKEVPHEDLTLVLSYEQDGAPLSEYDGKPLRIALVSTRGDYLTEGHYWVKWVDTIEVHTPAMAQSVGENVTG
jgi:DMSO/TMAO reductase YedYZ molybdopterin-dependent catalytic subunit